MIEIPYQRLGEDILQAIIEEFILREGTDYGVREADFADKVAQVHKQLASGEVVITFDPKTENCTCLLYTSPSPRDPKTSRMPSSA